MNLILFNTGWMTWNLSLAFTSVILGWAVLSVENKLLKAFLTLLWIAFIPNTIYILTDLYHFTYQQYLLSGFKEIILVAQYAIFIPFGFITFFSSMNLFEKALEQMKISRNFIFLLNFLIGIAMVVGRFLRSNSWDLFFNPTRAINDIFAVLITAPFLMLALLFGVLCNLLYLMSRESYVENPAQA